MKLLKLEISGFKSFAKKIELDFTRPITAIVGPNGSGKSNIVEAVRFVLGEQSMKSMRSKSGADLIFKGSKNLSRLNKASVSIFFDNQDRKFSLSVGEVKEGIKLDYDQVVISREVYTDGINRYLVNSMEVRLKDILEMLSGINIGSSSHYIISQGEADRLLNASFKERREIIEDALGLKAYHYRLRESDRKLEKTNENLKEAQSLRREITPHLQFLKKQVEKIKKSVELKSELFLLYKEFLKREEDYLQKENKMTEMEYGDLDKEIKRIDNILSDIGGKKSDSDTSLQLRLRFDKNEKEMKELRKLKDDLSRALGRLEGMIESEERRFKENKQTSVSPQKMVSKDKIEKLFQELNILIDEAMIRNDFSEIKESLKKIKETVSVFSVFELRAEKEKTDEFSNKEELAQFNSQKEKLVREIADLKNKENELYQTVESIKKEIKKEQESLLERNKEQFELSIKKEKLAGEQSILGLKRGNLFKLKNDLEESIKEAVFFFGKSALEYKNLSVVEEIKPREKQEERCQKIERIKIKLENVGGGGGDDIMKEYDNTLERDNFLAKEVSDLIKSIESLEILIKDLKERLHQEFIKGIEDINNKFELFFKEIFGGGEAKLEIVAEKKPAKKENEQEIIDTGVENEEEIVEPGINIRISLPHKKIKSLEALSGGERSLSSIALLFAITQVNPPPFLILDETDAALDEVNSRKYGDMLERLAKYLQLAVVTHNRETMSRVDILYGITIGADGDSKLLSVKFDEAVQIAK